MKNNCLLSSNLLKPAITLMAIILVLSLAKVFNFSPNWGKIVLAPASTITVTGEATQDQLNQLAEFNAGIEVIAENKESATNEVNQVMNYLITELKAFGIEEKDLETNRVNVYQEDEYLDLGARTDVKKGDWRASTNLSIIVRIQDGEDLATKSETVLGILNSSEANQISGPNFSLDQNQDNDEIELLQLAVKDAHDKALAIARSNNQDVDKILNIVEGQSSSPMFYDDMPRGLGVTSEMVQAELQPGSSKTSQSVTVTFELK